MEKSFVVASVGNGLYYYSQLKPAVQIDADDIGLYDPAYKVAEFPVEQDAINFVREHDHEHWN
jgi:hypothetical protein